MPPDPKGDRRKVASKVEWGEIARRKIGHCRGCGKEWDSYSSLHHLVPRSLGGDDVADNIVPLCGSGTTGCHGVYENHLRGWGGLAANIRLSLSEAERGYIITKKGPAFFDRYYPRDRSTHHLS